jgi:hypothetical protein
MDPMGSLAEQLKRYEEEHAFLRGLTLPEEDRARYTKWSGEYRWFGAPNIVCLEKARLLRRRQYEGLNAAEVR